jgi:hypothetical protein
VTEDREVGVFATRVVDGSEFGVMRCWWKGAGCRNWNERKKEETRSCDRAESTREEGTMTGVPFRNTASQTTSSPAVASPRLTGLSQPCEHTRSSISLHASPSCQTPSARAGRTPRHRVHTMNRFLTRLTSDAAVLPGLDTIL